MIRLLCAYCLVSLKRDRSSFVLFKIPFMSIDVPCPSLDVWDIGYQMGDDVAFSVYDSVNKVFLGEQSSE